MAKGRARKEGVWSKEIGRLQADRCRYRMRISHKSPIIQIAEISQGKEIRSFSSRVFRHDSDHDIRACASVCRSSHAAGEWDHSAGGAQAKQSIDTWGTFAETCRKDLRARIAREGSRRNAEGHLTEIGRWVHPAITSKPLEDWVQEKDPVTLPHAFRNRLETLSHINRARHLHGLDLTASIARLRALRPTGAIRREQQRRTQEVRAIPVDSQLQDWLDQMSGFEQWTLALISTYGLRPSEAWHVTQIDSDGWVHVPGDGLTKTASHIAPPVPAAWLDRYRLRENFDRFKLELNDRWKIRWEDRDGLLIPVNNSAVSNLLYRRIADRYIDRLEVDGEWVRPYDLRHSYAIRCFTSEEVIAATDESKATWMGHSLDIHRRVYLKFMGEDRRNSAIKAQLRFAVQNAPEGQEAAQPVDLPADVLDKLAKLEQLQKLLSQ